jgi:hypothetical protein
MQMTGTYHYGMNMETAHASFLGEIQHHSTSGTTAEPNSTPIPMLMTLKDRWRLMFHAEAFLSALQQSGPSGADKVFTYHTFRHTFGTLLNANGENPKIVQELLRHASLKVTTDVYMQEVSPQKREAQSKLVKMVLKKAASK